MFAVLSIIFSVYEISSIAKYICYTGLGIGFFYGLYLFIAWDFRKVKNFFKAKTQVLASKSKFVNKYVNDIYFRTMLLSTFSMIIGVIFVGYNAITGIIYKSVWNGSIAVYYFLLLCIRCYILANELKIHKNNFTEDEVALKRAKVFRIEGVLLVCLDIALIMPVTLLALFQRNINLPMWVAIGNAVYTFYKVIICIIGFSKTRKNNILSIKGLKNLNLTDALVSLLSLESTMIITFSDGTEPSMMILISMSAFVVLLIGVLTAVLTLVKGSKHVKVLKNGTN